MTKIIKYTLFTLLALLILIIAGSTILIMSVNPNDLKNPIAKQVKEMSGRQLTINGNITWSLFPWLGIHLHNLTLANPKNFSASSSTLSGGFASLKEADLKLRLIPLISGKFELGNLALKGLTINMVKRADGKNNWQFSEIKKIAAGKTLTTQKPTKITTHQANQSKHDNRYTLTPLALTITSVNISNANINYSDLKTKENYAIDNFNFQSKHISFHKAFPISSDFNFKSTAPNMSGRVSFVTKLDFDLPNQIINLLSANLSTHLIGKNLPQKGVNINLSATSNLDLKTSQLILKKLTGKIANLQFQAHLSGEHIFNHPQFSGTLEIPNFNPKLFIKNFSAKPLSLQNPNALESVSLKTQLTANKNSLTLNNFIVHLDGSKLTGTVALLNPPKGKSHFDLSIDQIQPLFRIASGMKKLQITGGAKINGTLSASGETQSVLMQTLKGNLQFNIYNGVIKGINIGHQLDIASALIDKKTVPSNRGANETPFGSLTGTITINNGIALNRDLLLQSPAIRVTGSGSANLAKQIINYGIQVIALEGSTPPRIFDFQKSIGGHFPIRITGSFENYQIYPDMPTILKAYALSRTKQEIGNQAEKALGKALGNQLKNIDMKSLQKNLRGLFR